MSYEANEHGLKGMRYLQFHPLPAIETVFINGSIRRITFLKT